ncbi:MAG: hypothetical protein EOR25_22285 [Mesorhizobium sp.]|uniref:hypothetical protein n=1 Tax=Mesorhizobium sp. TaxID=1871066 RepID=UPI000FE36E85|nr:hypothetical protein [Mesorhizobium sp.]RWJ15194.1 MAG: hypothetical protein EOR25_22285 [Mesorhizobium sp.]
MVNVSTATASFFWNETGDVIVEQRIPVLGGDYEALDCQFLQALWRMELCEAVYNLEVSRGGDGLDGIARGGWQAVSGIRQVAYSLPNSYGACGIVSLPGQTTGFQRLAEAAGKSYDDYIKDMETAVTQTADSFTDTAAKLAHAVSKRQTLPEIFGKTSKAGGRSTLGSSSNTLARINCRRPARISRRQMSRFR